MTIIVEVVHYSLRLSSSCIDCQARDRSKSKWVHLRILSSQIDQRAEEAGVEIEPGGSRSWNSNVRLVGERRKHFWALIETVEGGVGGFAAVYAAVLARRAAGSDGEEQHRSACGALVGPITARWLDGAPWRDRQGSRGMGRQTISAKAAVL